MKKGNETYCDKCHLIVAPKEPGRLNYGNFDFHGGCYISYRREKKEPERKSA